MKSIFRLIAIAIIIALLTACGGGSGSTDTSQRPSKVAFFAAAVDDQQVDLRWDPVAGATSYNIYWDTTKSVTSSDQSITISGTSYSHTQLQNGTEYFYVIEAVNEDGASPFSYEIAAIPFTTELTNWSKIYPSADNTANKSLFNITASDDLLIATGLYGAIRVSETGQEWNEIAFANRSHLYGVQFHNDEFMAVNFDGEILTSPNGYNWTAEQSFDVSFRGLEIVNDKYFAFGASGMLYVSDNGVSWAEHFVADYSINGIKFFNNEYIAITSRGIYSSSDLLNWQERSFSAVEKTLYGIDSDGSRAVIVGPNGQIMTSIDGMEWQLQTSGTSERLRSVFWDGSDFIVTGEGVVLISSDGVNWIQSPTAELSDVSLMESVAYKNEYFAVGYNDLIMSSPDKLNWSVKKHKVSEVNYITDIKWTGNNEWLASDQNGRLLRSVDGLTWNIEAIAGSEYLYSVADFNGKTFGAVNDGIMDLDSMTSVYTAPYNRVGKIAVSDNYIVGAVLADVITYSADGSTWQTASVNGFFWDVEWTGSQFVASGAQYSGNWDLIIATTATDDPSNWTTSVVSTNNSTLFRGRGVAVGNGLYVVTDAGGRVHVSNDSINWQEIQIEDTNLSVYDVKWTGSQWVAAVSSGNIYVSSDAINWTLEEQLNSSTWTLGLGNGQVISGGQGNLHKRN